MIDVETIKDAISDAVSDIAFDYSTEKEMMAAEAKMNLSIRDYLKEHNDEIIYTIRKEYNIPENDALYIDLDKLELVWCPNQTIQTVWFSFDITKTGHGDLEEVK